MVTRSTRLLIGLSWTLIGGWGLSAELYFLFGPQQGAVTASIPTLALSLLSAISGVCVIRHHPWGLRLLLLAAVIFVGLQTIKMIGAPSNANALWWFMRFLWIALCAVSVFALADYRLTTNQKAWLASQFWAGVALVLRAVIALAPRQNRLPALERVAPTMAIAGVSLQLLSLAMLTVSSRSKLAVLSPMQLAWMVSTIAFSMAALGGRRWAAIGMALSIFAQSLQFGSPLEWLSTANSLRMYGYLGDIWRVSIGMEALALILAAIALVIFAVRPLPDVSSNASPPHPMRYRRVAVVSLLATGLIWFSIASWSLAGNVGNAGYFLGLIFPPYVLPVLLQIWVASFVPVILVNSTVRATLAERFLVAVLLSLMVVALMDMSPLAQVGTYRYLYMGFPHVLWIPFILAALALTFGEDAWRGRSVYRLKTVTV